MAPKRKSDSGVATDNAKKVKTDASQHASAKAILAKLASCPETESALDFANETEVRKAFKDVANYVHDLENEVGELKKAQAVDGGAKPMKPKEQIEAEADLVADKLVRGIKKQLTWKPSCKTNSAKFVYDGLCPDPLVFGAMLKLGGPPKFKQKKMPGSELEKLVGRIIGSVRYNDLYISKGDVNIRYNSDTGEFKISGSYGIDA